MNFLCLDIQILFISTEKSCSKLLTMHSRTFAIRPNLHQPHVLLFFSPLSVSHHSVHQPCWTFPKHTLPSCVLRFLNSVSSPGMLFLLLSSIQQILIHPSKSDKCSFIHWTWEMLDNGELNHMYPYLHVTYKLSHKWKNSNCDQCPCRWDSGCWESL